MKRPSTRNVIGLICAILLLGGLFWFAFKLRQQPKHNKINRAFIRIEDLAGEDYDTVFHQSDTNFAAPDGETYQIHTSAHWIKGSKLTYYNLNGDNDTFMVPDYELLFSGIGNKGTSFNRKYKISEIEKKFKTGWQGMSGFYAPILMGYSKKYKGFFFRETHWVYMSDGIWDKIIMLNRKGDIEAVEPGLGNQDGTCEFTSDGEICLSMTGLYSFDFALPRLFNEPNDIISADFVNDSFYLLIYNRDITDGKMIQNKNGFLYSIDGKLIDKFDFDGIQYAIGPWTDVFHSKNTKILALCDDSNNKVMVVQSKPPYIKEYTFKSLKSSIPKGLECHCFQQFANKIIVYFDANGKPISYIKEEGQCDEK